MGATMIKPRENEYPGAFHIHGVLYAISKENSKTGLAKLGSGELK